jgi:hypothetical protein
LPVGLNLQILLGLYDALVVSILSLQIISCGVLNHILTAPFLLQLHHFVIIVGLLVRETKIQVIDYELLLAMDRVM